MMSAVARPQLRGLLKTKLKRDFLITCVACAVAGLGWRYGVQIPRRNKYEEYFKNMDPEKDYLRMREAGVFTCVRPGGEVQGGW